MKPNLFPLFVYCLTFLFFCTPKIKPTDKQDQGITGFVYTISGNQMPMKTILPSGKPSILPDGKKTGDSSKLKGIQSTIYIYTPTTIQQVIPSNASSLYTAINTPLVATVLTDSSGSFRITLPVGDYSLFLKLGDQFYANNFNQFNQIALVHVEAGRFTAVKLTLNNGATY
jgi:hypothetical protein